jgi:hypothetical protein
MPPVGFQAAARCLRGGRWGGGGGEAAVGGPGQPPSWTARWGPAQQGQVARSVGPPCSQWRRVVALATRPAWALSNNTRGRQRPPSLAPGQERRVGVRPATTPVRCWPTVRGWLGGAAQRSGFPSTSAGTWGGPTPGFAAGSGPQPWWHGRGGVGGGGDGGGGAGYHGGAGQFYIMGVGGVGGGGGGDTSIPLQHRTQNTQNNFYSYRKLKSLYKILMSIILPGKK